MTDLERKEAGADFSDRPKSRAAPEVCDSVLIAGSEHLGPQEILGILNDFAAFQSPNGNIFLEPINRLIFPIPARSGPDEAGTGPDSRAESEQSR